MCGGEEGASEWSDSGGGGGGGGGGGIPIGISLSWFQKKDV